MNKIIAYICFVAILPLPYTYYILLRPAVCLGMIFLLVRDGKRLSNDNKAICIVIAVLFNPFFAIYLSKFVWIPIDLLSGFYLLRKYELRTS